MNAPLCPLAGFEFALVGPGRVGSSLAHWATTAGARCRSVVGRPGGSSAPAIAARLDAPVVELSGFDPERLPLVLIAVPDHSLETVARRLAARPATRTVALHVSGIHGASVLEPLARAGYRTGSLHPLRAFPTAEPELERAAGTFFALDGDAEARALGRRLAAAFGGSSAVVAESDRALYHWAASLAAGGVVTLLATAVAAGRRLGLPEAALAGYGELARGALAAALAQSDPARAITGPVARGDLESVERHTTALARDAPDLLPLALEVARATLARRAELEPPEPPHNALAELLRRAGERP